MPIATPLTTHGVVRLAHELSRPVKNGEPATVPDRVANMYLDMRGEWRLPKLAGICTTPILRDDGSIARAEGYDLTTGVYCHGIPEITVPERPTREQAETALQTIRDTFRTFPFADAARRYDVALGVDIVDHGEPIGIDETSFVCALLTAICRPSLWLAPGLLLNAPAISGAGSGKGLLVRAIGMIAYGAHVRPFTPGNDRHEMDKRLVAEIMEGKPILAMDNVNATLLRSNTLASLLTERPAGVRILGQSRMVTLEHASFIALTGNGLTVSEDLARRFLYCELDAHCEDPERRSFEPGFIDSIRMHRSGLLAAALTIWRWGRQTRMNRGIPLGSFEHWGVWVRDPLLALGCPDPVDRVRQIKERDPARQRVIELFAAWWEAHRDSPIRAADLAPEVREIVDPSQRGRQYLARAIQGLIGTRQGGFTLERVAELPNKRKAGTLYRLQQVSPRHPADSSASSASSAFGEKNNGKSPFLRARMTRMPARMTRMPPTTRIWAWMAKMPQKTWVRTRKVRMTRMARMSPATTLPAAATTAARSARPAAGTGPDGRTAFGCICAAKSRGLIRKREVCIK
jgi:putative DNA primase/helicase